jgi:hypothetical protein
MNTMNNSMLSKSSIVSASSKQYLPGYSRSIMNSNTFVHTKTSVYNNKDDKGMFKTHDINAGPPTKLSNFS